MLDNKVRAIREDIGMSVAELARRSGMTRQTISNIEQRKHEPRGLHLMTISHALRRDPREIFFVHGVKHVEQEQG